MKRFRGGLVFKAHRFCVSLNSRLESNKERRRRETHRGDCRPFGTADPQTGRFKAHRFKAHRLVYHSTLGLRVMKKKKRSQVRTCHVERSSPSSILLFADLPTRPEEIPGGTEKYNNLLSQDVLTEWFQKVNSSTNRQLIVAHY